MPNQTTAIASTHMSNGVSTPHATCSASGPIAVSTGVPRITKIRPPSSGLTA